MVDLQVAFDWAEDNAPRFEELPDGSKLHARKDICAFLLLHKLSPRVGDIISGAGHDQIWLNVDFAKLAEMASQDDINLLSACGVFIDSDDAESLSMFA